MVRQKNRWLLVRIDNASTIVLSTNQANENKTKKKTNNKERMAMSLSSSILDFPSKKEIAFCIRQNITACFGLAAEAAAYDTQVRFWDATTRMVLLRVSRQYCNLVRSSLTLLTTLGISSSSKQQQQQQQHNNGFSSKRIVASVLSVNGSARTAKVSAMARIRKYYKDNILLPLQESNENGAEFKRACRELEETIEAIQTMDM